MEKNETRKATWLEVGRRLLRKGGPSKEATGSPSAEMVSVKTLPALAPPISPLTNILWRDETKGLKRETFIFVGLSNRKKTSEGNVNQHK